MAFVKLDSTNSQIGPIAHNSLECLDHTKSCIESNCDLLSTTPLILKQEGNVIGAEVVKKEPFEENLVSDNCDVLNPYAPLQDETSVQLFNPYAQND